MIKKVCGFLNRAPFTYSQYLPTQKVDVRCCPKKATIGVPRCAPSDIRVQKSAYIVHTFDSK